MTSLGAAADDAIGPNYGNVRRADPRIAGEVWSAWATQPAWSKPTIYWTFVGGRSYGT